ncbi:hypothetical protein OXX59_002162 [Metschnikowia pulcherrima]
MIFRAPVFAIVFALSGFVAAEARGKKLWISWDAASSGVIEKRDLNETDKWDSAVITYVANDFTASDSTSTSHVADLQPILNHEVHIGDSLAAYLAQIDTHKRLVVQPLNDVERFKRTPGDTVSCASVAEITRRYQLICHWAQHVWSHYTTSGTQVYLNQQAYAVVPQDGNLISKETRFDGHIGDIASTVIAGSTERCTGEIQMHGDWTVMTRVSHEESKGCFTELNKENLQEALAECIKEAENRCAVSYCCRLRDDHKWTGDVRLQRSDITFSSIKDIKCAY